MLLRYSMMVEMSEGNEHKQHDILKFLCLRKDI